jgi:hypothetical protein
MNDNIVDLAGENLRANFRKAMQDAYAAGRACGIKEGVDLVVDAGKAADTQSACNLCIVLADALVRKIKEAPEFPEYMR